MREAQKVGAAGVIIEGLIDFMCVCVCVCVLLYLPLSLSLSLSDNIPTDDSGSTTRAFSMSGDASSSDIEIPSVFMLTEGGARLRQLAADSNGEEVFVLLTWKRDEGEEQGAESGDGGQSSDSESPESEGQADKQPLLPSHSSSDSNL